MKIVNGGMLSSTKFSCWSSPTMIKTSGLQRRDFLPQLIDGVHAAFPLGPFDFIGLSGELRFVRQTLALASIQKVPVARIEHQLWGVGHGHAAD